MEVVLNNSIIYQQIFINWWIEEKNNYYSEYNEKLKRYFDEEYLGIEYNGSFWYQNYAEHKRKVINEHKFFLAKIKHGF